MAGKQTSRPPITSHESASPSPQCDHGRNYFHQFKDCVEKRALKSLHIQVLLGKSSLGPVAWTFKDNVHMILVVWVKSVKVIGPWNFPL